MRLGTLAAYQQMVWQTKGLTLTEILVVVAIVAIASTAAIGSYGVAMRRQQYDAARDILLTMAAGEAVYATLNTNAYYPGAAAMLGSTCNTAPLPPAPFVAARCLSYCNPVTAACVAGWKTVYMDDPNLSSTPVRYRMYTRVTPDGFRGEAVLNGLVMTIDENRTIAGTWTRP